MIVRLQLYFKQFLFQLCHALLFVGRVCILKRIGWRGGKTGKSWEVRGRENKAKFQVAKQQLTHTLRPGNGRKGIYYELPDPKVSKSYDNFTYTSLFILKEIT